MPRAMNVTDCSSPFRLSSVIAVGFSTSSRLSQPAPTPSSVSNSMLRVADCQSLRIMFMPFRTSLKADIERHCEPARHWRSPRINSNKCELTTRIHDTGEVHFRIRSAVMRLPQDCYVVRGHRQCSALAAEAPRDMRWQRIGQRNIAQLDEVSFLNEQSVVDAGILLTHALELFILRRIIHIPACARNVERSIGVPGGSERTAPAAILVFDVVQVVPALVIEQCIHAPVAEDCERIGKGDFTRRRRRPDVDGGVRDQGAQFVLHQLAVGIASREVSEIRTQREAGLMPLYRLIQRERDWIALIAK